MDLEVDPKNHKHICIQNSETRHLSSANTLWQYSINLVTVHNDLKLFQNNNLHKNSFEKGAMLLEKHMFGAHLSSIHGYITESVMYGQFDARSTVTFTAIQHHCILASIKLHCLVSEAHVCEQLSQGHYVTLRQ